MARQLAGPTLAFVLAALTACDDHLLGVDESLVDRTYDCSWAGVKLMVDDHCDACHYTGSTVYADIVTDVVVEQSDGDPANDRLVIPGDPDASVLWLALTGDSSDVVLMPFLSADAPLPAETVDHVRCWIEDGAPLVGE